MADSERDAAAARALAAEVCRRVLGDDELEPLWPEAHGGLRRLEHPLRVAITGRGSAGKSTLVNALVGGRVAATGEGETTTVNCEFRSAADSDERAEVHLAGADAVQTVAVEDVAGLSGLDTRVPIPIVVHLRHPLLERLTVIDSPGLGSPNEEVSDRALQVTGAAIRDADAAVFVTSELPGRADEYEELDRFRRLFGDVRRAPTNSLYVFNQADRVEGPSASDPVGSASRRLERHRHELRQRVAGASATVGIVAEAARTGFVDDPLVADLVALGRHVADPRDLADGELLATLDVPDVSAERRRELTARLGGFGIVAGVDLVHAAGITDAAELSTRLFALSGMAALEDMLERDFASRSGLLRADTTLGALRRRATDLLVAGALSRQARDRVDAWVHESLLLPAAFPLRRLHALWLTFEPRIGLDEDALEEVRDVLGGGTGLVDDDSEGSPAESPAEIAARAATRAVIWRSFAARLPETNRREVAEVAALTYRHLARRTPEEESRG